MQTFISQLCGCGGCFLVLWDRWEKRSHLCQHAFEARTIRTAHLPFKLSLPQNSYQTNKISKQLVWHLSRCNSWNLKSAKTFYRFNVCSIKTIRKFRCVDNRQKIFILLYLPDIQFFLLSYIKKMQNTYNWVYDNIVLFITSDYSVPIQV